MKKILIVLTGPLISSGCSGATFDKKINRKDRVNVTFDCTENIKKYYEVIYGGKFTIDLAYLAWAEDVDAIEKFKRSGFPNLDIIQAGVPLSKYRDKWQFEAFLSKECKQFILNGSYDIVFRIRADVLLKLDILVQQLNTLKNVNDKKIIVPYIAKGGKMQDYYFGGTPKGLLRFCQNIRTGNPVVQNTHFDALINQTSLRRYKNLHKIKRRYIAWITRLVGYKIQVPLDKEIYNQMEWRGAKFKNFIGHM